MDNTAPIITDKTIYISQFRSDLIALDLKTGEVLLDVPPIIIDNTTMMPIRFISDILDFDVRWDEQTRSVYIIKSYRDYGIGTLIIDGQVFPQGIGIKKSIGLMVNPKILFRHIGAEYSVLYPASPEAYAILDNQKNIFSIPPNFKEHVAFYNGKEIPVASIFGPGEILYVQLSFFEQAFGWKYTLDIFTNTLEIITDQH
ncbi:hypothetical protein BHU72_10005 [Desulfuribacillus stibiiarsenatis]|uniref:Copper amine oxidase-like N-terminal domain-containing protein n=1 Tax=Desulfuribacillus stibiiarsenatis TaxID=1390249 RepID=A0A1E5L8V9_9FIRM|nr:copper amine oxidase N-terminal domain-containing protein [Desulfuribacillus stibiiarsenatis]OEH86585.1 hypothetical protein BHU72_10005 [Desulfuribacillus stibiiarsenatis]